MEQPKPIFIELHDGYDYSHKMMINIYARVNLRERGYDVAETYDEMKIKIETAMESE